MLRGRSHARTIRSSGTGSGWVARNRSTRRVRVAAGTWLMGRSWHRRRAAWQDADARGQAWRAARGPCASARCVPVVPSVVPVSGGRAGGRRARARCRRAVPHGRRARRVVGRGVVHVGVDPVRLAQGVLLAGLLHGVALAGALCLELRALGLGALELGLGLGLLGPVLGLGQVRRLGRRPGAELLGVGPLLLGLALLAERQDRGDQQQREDDDDGEDDPFRGAHAGAP